MKKNAPIGIFDSGIGGTSIWKEMNELLPMESSIYLADSKNAPYGTKSKEEIIRFCVKNTEYLLKQGCKMVVVACNTATTNAIELLRKNYPIPFIGIEPAIKPASLKTKTKSIGILATKGTLASALFMETASIYSNGIRVIEQEGTGLVELIENGKIDSIETKTLLQKYIDPMLSANIDHLVLGCSHYPYLIPILKELLPPEIQIIDSGLAVAKQSKNVLEQHGLLWINSPAPKSIFYTNGDPSVLNRILGNKYFVKFLDF